MPLMPAPASHCAKVFLRVRNDDPPAPIDHLRLRCGRGRGHLLRTGSSGDHQPSRLQRIGLELATGLQCEGGEQLGCVVGAEGVAGQNPSKRSAKIWRGHAGTSQEPPPAVKLQPHGMATPRKIERASLIPTVPPTAHFAAARAGNRSPAWFCYQNKAAIPLDNNQYNLPAI